MAAQTVAQKPVQRVRRNWWSLATLAVLVVAGFLLLVVPVYSKVFTPSGVLYTTNDAYWHMRIIDNLAANFPHLNQIDPYQLYPSGEPMDRIHMFDWMVSGVAWAANFVASLVQPNAVLGHPNPQIVDAVAAFAPPVFAVGIWVLVYLIGATLFAPWVGLLATMLTITMPGELMGRSGLGSTDVHVVEVFWLTLITYLLVRALKSERDWWTTGAGIAFGAYFGTWVGAMTQGFAIGMFFLVALIVGHVRGQSTKATAHTGAVFFVAAMGAILPFSPGIVYVAALSLTSIGLLALGEVSRWSSKHPKILFPMIVILLLFIGAATMKWLLPTQFEGVAANFSRFIPKAAQVTELQPLFAPRGNFMLDIVWLNFRGAFYIGIAGLAVAVWQCIRRRDPALALLVILGLMAFAMTMAERRYGYYFTVDVALFGGYLLWLIGKGVRRSVRMPEAAIAVGVLVCAAVVPNVSPALAIASTPSYVTTAGWQESLTWLKNNSPEPFLKGKDYYYSQYGEYRDRIDAREAYAVTAWTDYGYWITRIAHRPPADNPGHLPLPNPAVFKMLTTDNVTELRELERQTRTWYIVLDYDTVVSKLPGILGYFGLETDRYFGRYQVTEGGKTRTTVLFYPDYYRMAMVRLFWFDGKAVTPAGVAVIKHRITPEQVLVVDQSWKLPTYEDAVRFVAANPGTRIVGTNPTVSPVPLEKLEGHELVHQWPGKNAMETVKVFKVGGN